MRNPLISGLRRIAAIGCIAVSCLFCIQTTLAHLDRVEHVLGIDHDAVPLAGPVHHHHASDNTAADCGEPTGTHPVSHSHVGDTISPFFVAADFGLIVPLPLRAGGDPLDGSPRCGIGARTPDRPPKA